MSYLRRNWLLLSIIAISTLSYLKMDTLNDEIIYLESELEDLKYDSENKAEELQDEIKRAEQDAENAREETEDAERARQEAEDELEEITD